MKNTLLFAIISTLLFSCKKDTLPLYSAWKGVQTYGYAKAKRNGQDWEGSAWWAYVSGDSSKISLIVNTFDIQGQDTIIIEEFGFLNIPKKVDNYIMSDFEGQLKLLPTAIYGLGIDDQADAFWGVNTKFSNTVAIISFDEVSGTVRGRFNLVFKKSIDTREDEGGFPSKVSFEDGTFEARRGL
jgi:hypothetical protein